MCRFILVTAFLRLPLKSLNFMYLMMENKNNLEIVIDFLRKLPLWLRLLLLAAISVAVAFSFQSCANTKAVVRASSENTSASVSITTNNPTSVTVTNRQDTVGLHFNPSRK